MKKLLFSVATMALLFVACSKENESTKSASDAGLNAAPPIEFSAATLCFASMEELDNTISEIAMMTSEQKQQWAASHAGFTSMNDAANTVVEQMISLSDPSEIPALQKAYSELFIFDSNPREVRVLPFFKSNRIGYAFVCNAYGNVEVAGQVVNLNDITTYEETTLGKAETENRVRTRANNPLYGVNYYEMVTATKNHRFSVTAISKTTNDPGLLMVFLKYAAETGFEMGGTQYWFPNVDTFTVSYTPGITNNDWVFLFEGNTEYRYMLSEGTAFTKNLPSPSYVLEERLGALLTGYDTGYRITSKYAEQNGILFIRDVK